MGTKEEIKNVDEISRDSHIHDEIHDKESIDIQFNTFLTKFFQTNEFQKSRVEFPLKATILNEDYEKQSIKIKSENYRISQVELSGTTDYKVEVLEEGSLGKVSLFGIDNGISTSYTFIKKDGKWYLNELSDLST
ncbi:hypothetical protein [Aureivirga sp. CE67]|uniref:hypothetical protein n=1 Tax=Aureivirga sp. CE67 TaxID=1788983 RepID=UPI0018CB44D3|nr:hypothetical protein [Aureivirga sp. CE67]